MSSSNRAPDPASLDRSSGPANSHSSLIRLDPKFREPQNHRPSRLDRIIVNTNQSQGNPLIKELDRLIATKAADIKYEFSTKITADYVVGYTCSMLFLALNYYSVHPGYIEGRMKSVDNVHDLKILLVVINVDNPDVMLKELAITCAIQGFTLIVTASFKEAASYLIYFHRSQNEDSRLIQKVAKEGFKDKIAALAGTMSGVGAPDLLTMVGRYGSLKEAITVSEKDEIEELPGWGQRKVSVFRKAFDEPFYYQ